MPHIHEKIDFVVGVYIMYGNRVLLAHHKGLGLWLPIGGHIELDEDPEDALFREIYEETGFTKDNITLIGDARIPSRDDEDFKPLLTPLYLDIHRISPTHRHINMTYFAKAATDSFVLNTAEHHDIKWFSREQIQSLSLKEDVRWCALEALTYTAHTPFSV